MNCIVSGTVLLEERRLRRILTYAAVLLAVSSDMKESVIDAGWTIAPTTDMLQNMLSMQEFNTYTCENRMHRRRLFTEV